MTNEQIIRTAKVMAGVAEESHTFAHWKALGYAVRKGEHATFKAAIWKYAANKRATEDPEADGEKPTGGRMFLKTAHFFTRSQVDPIAAR